MRIPIILSYRFWNGSGLNDWSSSISDSSMLWANSAVNFCLCVHLCPILCDPKDYSPPGSSVHEIFQPRTLEPVAISYSRGPSPPRGGTQVSWLSCIGRQILYHRTTWKTLSLDYKGLQDAQSMGEISSSVLGQVTLPKEETLQLKLSPGWLRNPPKGECRSWLYISMFPPRQHYAHNARRKREYGPFHKTANCPIWTGSLTLVK